MTLNRYSFVLVPTGPLRGAWMRREDWHRLSPEELGDACDDVVRVAYDHSYTEMYHEMYDLVDDVVEVRFKIADDVSWFKLTALAGMGHAAFFSYDPDKPDPNGSEDVFS